MSDVDLKKPALSRAGKLRRFFDKDGLFALSLLGIAFVVVGFADNPTVEDYTAKQWAGKCASYDGHLGTVSDVEIGGNYAMVSRLDGTARERLALSKVVRVDCPVGGSKQDISELVATVVPDKLDELSERKNDIVRLKHDVEMMKLRVELARLAKEYYDVINGNNSESGDSLQSQDTAGDEIDDNKRRIDDLKSQIERSKIARDYYNQLKDHEQSELQSDDPHGPKHRRPSDPSK